MKQYLIDFFKYNDWAYRQVLSAIAALPEKVEVLKLMDHVIMAQRRWYNRVVKEVDDSSISWAGQAFPVNEIEAKWGKNVSKWLKLLEQTDGADLEKYIVFARPSDGKNMKVKLRDIMLQINYHAIHHRAQINRIMREQGHPIPSTDYIVTVLQEA